MSDTYDIHSQYGMTFVPLTADRGAGELICYLTHAILDGRPAPLGPYGCHNKPRPHAGQPLWVQNGWTDDGRRLLELVTFAFVEGCQYDQSGTDARCAGCRHAKE